MAEAEELISELEEKMVEMTSEKQNKVRKNEKNWGHSKTSGTMSNTTFEL